MGHVHDQSLPGVVVPEPPGAVDRDLRQRAFNNLERNDPLVAV
jgi:hypothetical protein